MRHLWVATSANRRDDAVETAVGRVIDDPAALLVLVDLLDFGLELGPRVEPVLLP